MRRFMVLVTVVVLMTAMLVASAAPAAAFARVDVSEEFPFLVTGGTPVPTVACDVAADGSGPIGWRNGTCWVFHPVSVSGF
jgi:hypothetical protein